MKLRTLPNPTHMRRMINYGIKLQCLLSYKKGRRQHFIDLKLRNGLCIHAGEKIEFLDQFVNIYIRQRYTPPSYEIKQNDVVIDIGANIGMFSLFAAMQDPSVEVYSFEPFMNNFILLEKNKILNK